MPEIKRELTKAERDILWEEAGTEAEERSWPVRLVEGPDAVRGAIAEIHKAVRLVEDVAALYDDIGWAEEDDNRTTFELTLPDERLRSLGAMLRETATDLLTDELEGPFAGGRPQHVERDHELLRIACGMEGTDPAGLLERFTSKGVS